MNSSTVFAVGVALTFLGACSASRDEATVIEFGADATTTTTEQLRLEYTEFPDLEPNEAALCNWIDQTNRQTEAIAKRDRSADANFGAQLSSLSLSEPVREGIERDYLVALNSLQIEGYAAIASGAEVALTDVQRAELETAQKAADALTGFNETLNSPETLVELEDRNVLATVIGRQGPAMPPLVDQLDQAVATFNEWAWKNCRTGGLKMVWDDFIPYEALES